MRKKPRRHTRRLASINPQHFKKKSVVINPDNVVKITAPKKGYVRFDVQNPLKRRLIDRKTYDVYFIEDDSGREGMVVLNAWNKSDLINYEFKKFKDWTITKIEPHHY